MAKWGPTFRHTHRRQETGEQKASFKQNKVATKRIKTKVQRKSKVQINVRSKKPRPQTYQRGDTRRYWRIDRPRQVTRNKTDWRSNITEWTDKHMRENTDYIHRDTDKGIRNRWGECGGKMTGEVMKGWLLFLLTIINTLECVSCSSFGSVCSACVLVSLLRSHYLAQHDYSASDWLYPAHFLSGVYFGGFCFFVRLGQTITIGCDNALPTRTRTLAFLCCLSGSFDKSLTDSHCTPIQHYWLFTVYMQHTVSKTHTKC